MASAGVTAVARPIPQAVCLAFGTVSALGLGRFAYGLLLPVMREDLGWSLSAAGVLATANGFGYLIGALATTRVARRIGSARTFRWGMVLTAVSLAATGVSGDYRFLLALRAVAGISGAAVFISGGVIAARMAARAASGSPITVYFAGTGLGIVLSGVALPMLGDHWQTAWFGSGVAAGLAAAISWHAARDDETISPRSGRARLRPLRPTVLAYLLFAAGYITYITFLSAHLAAHAAGTVQVVIAWATMGLAVLAGPIIWSRPISRRPLDRVLALVLALLAGSAALALWSAAVPAMLASAAVYGATFMTVPALVTALVKNNTPPADWTATLAACTTVFAAGQTVGPWLAGLLADHTATTAPLLWTVLLCATGSVIATAQSIPAHSDEENDHDDLRTDSRYVPRWLVLRGNHRAPARARSPRSAADADRGR
ncbi:YbfB/YjiJ family MFS transporter [Nocardia sp. NBC_00416]|uniref:YbfB/YjiJ family MFS transporter n=1 Tax=Nocardia sp. NBC_00416 TaxID=2975991 RepID=UPI002E2262D6